MYTKCPFRVYSVCIILQTIPGSIIKSAMSCNKRYEWIGRVKL